MKTLSSVAVMLLGGLGLLGSLPAAAAERVADTGQQEYYNKCASCHGVDAKGQGLVAKFLIKAPTDLTALSKNNGGVFPFGRVYGVIDGRQAVKLHGERTMPVWGRGYLREETGATSHVAGTKADRELYVRLRILALIDYLNQLQGK